VSGPRRDVASLAREVRLMLTATLGNWNKVPQLGFLMCLLAGLLLAVSVGAGVVGPMLAASVEPLLTGITTTPTP
jgi:hypothetical protein